MVAVVPALVGPAVGQSLGVNTDEGPTSLGGEMSGQDPKTRTRARTGNRKDRGQGLSNDQGTWYLTENLAIV